MFGKFREFLDNLLLYPLKFQIFFLFLISFLVVILGALLISENFKSLSEAFWWSLNHIIDTGNLVEDKGLFQRALGLAITLIGLAFFGLFISVLTAFLERRLEELRRGKRAVYDREHIVILGWNEGIYTLLEEIYHENPKNRVVIMSSLPKESVKEALDFYKKIKKVKFPKISIRNGDMGDLKDLRRLNLEESKAVIILRNEEDEFLPYSQLKEAENLDTIRAVYGILKLSNTFNRKLNVTTLVDEPILEKIFRNLSTQKVNFLPLNYERYLGNLIAFSSLYPKLAEVYFELFSYKGSEIYLETLGDLKRKYKTFGELYSNIENAICLGLKRGDNIFLIPPPETELKDFDSAIILGETEGGFKTTTQRENIPNLDVKIIIKTDKPKRILCLGFGNKFEYMLKALRSLYNTDETQIIKKNRKIELNDESIYEYLKELEKFLIESKPFDTIILVEDLSSNTKNIHDTKILLQASVILEVYSKKKRKSQVIVELENPKNSEIAQAEVIVLSSKLSNQLMLQAVLDPLREQIFEELLTVKGNELVIYPVEFSSKRTTFKVLVENLYRKYGVIPIGFIKSGRIYLNPPQNGEVKSGTELILLGNFH